MFFRNKILFVTFILSACMYFSCRKNKIDDSNNLQLTLISLPDLFQYGKIINDTIVFSLPYGTELSQVRIHYEGIGFSDASIKEDTYIDLRNINKITIKNNSSSRTYFIALNLPSHPDTSIRSVWVTNVGSPALSSPENIKSTVDYIKSLKFNMIYVDVFNKNQTLFPSKILKENVPPGTQTQIFGDGWDPLKILIDYAHSKNIKVIAWLEYGFISHYTGYPHPILDQHPDWVSYDRNGISTVRNGFTWLNGFNSQVQDFILKLILEAVKNYNLDGIQCDDHLPSMPLNSGYDSLTISQYEKETGNSYPLSDSDPDWIKWRANRLTMFAKVIYDSVKAEKPSCLVSFAPGPLDWSLQNNLADWETWIKLKIVDIISPLLYRNESQGLSAYTSLIDKDISRILKLYPYIRKGYSPGIMIKNGNYSPSDDYLARVLQYNFFNNIESASFWYYDGLANNIKVFHAFYPAEAVFPDFNE